VLNYKIEYELPLYIGSLTMSCVVNSYTTEQYFNFFLF